MAYHPLKQIIEAADKAITEEDFVTLMAFYADNATLVIKPGLIATGKEQIHKAFLAITEYFNHSLVVKQGAMHVIQSGNTALVIMETVLETADAAGVANCMSRRATYVFREDPVGKWLCVIDNSYGTDLLGAI
ncbi:nuclear transport factor 2 family protein [Methylomonas sp. EFPC1]|uniref:YybH family protein n=1 Tax=unclassified Methylomonas TaxID=2608980 RepID=UPI00051C22B5|nr:MULTISPECIES: nuclear transport factor 2 family protein [unclassified Methylomonas]NOV29388.1 DUF4440 domain-containing protein [Methylomonas sp. ZR1]PKD40581.1 DUF4440 domain-containing protein [Methylomonas sp. Kb3]QBC27711.1 DUF4440 domain-containing protein [Methylomonas sp. LW13]QSB03329.1 nuclear transport factor 2 family protein [Methylomonas sp. EFPC1]